MPIDIGTNKIGKINVGSSAIGKVYVGSDLVYSSGPKIPIYGMYKYSGFTYAYWMMGGISTNNYLAWTNGSVSNLNAPAISQISGTLGTANSTISIGSRTVPYLKTFYLNNVAIYLYSSSVKPFYPYYVLQNSQVGDKCLYGYLNIADYYGYGLEFYIKPRSVINENTIEVNNERDSYYTFTRTSNQIRNYWWTHSGLILMS